MIKVVGVKFNSSIKAYDFDPSFNKVSLNDYVLVETVQGKEVGKVVYLGKEIDEEKLEVPLKEVIKILDDKELSRLSESKDKIEKEIPTVQKIIQKLKLPMRLLFLEENIFENRIDIFFASEGRVDFRIAVKELSKSFKSTVRLRQVGTRDQAKLLGGFGQCGNEVCCKKFLNVVKSLKREEAESITGSRNLSKHMGICGNLMCCISFEKDVEKGKKIKEAAIN